MRWPLLDAWRSRGAGLDGPGRLFVASMVWLWGMTAVVVVSPDWWLARSHHQGSFPVWAATQTVPFMYTLETDWEAEREAPPREDLAEDCAKNGMRGLRQHVPLGQITNPQRRPMFRLCGLPATVTLTSRLREHRITTRWRLEEVDGVLVIEALP